MSEWGGFDHARAAPLPTYYNQGFQEQHQHHHKNRDRQEQQQHEHEHEQRNLPARLPPQQQQQRRRRAEKAPVIEKERPAPSKSGSGSGSGSSSNTAASKSTKPSSLTRAGASYSSTLSASSSSSSSSSSPSASASASTSRDSPRRSTTTSPSVATARSVSGGSSSIRSRGGTSTTALIKSVVGSATRSARLPLVRSSKSSVSSSSNSTTASRSSSIDGTNSSRGGHSSRDSLSLAPPRDHNANANANANASTNTNTNTNEQQQQKQHRPSALQQRLLSETRPSTAPQHATTTAPTPSAALSSPSSPSPSSARSPPSSFTITHKNGTATTRIGRAAADPPGNTTASGSSQARAARLVDRRPPHQPTRPSSRIRSSLDISHATMYSDQDPNTNRPITGVTKQISLPPSFGRAESVSSTSGTASISANTMNSTDPSALSESSVGKGLVYRNGRAYYNDATLQYPLPCDLTELHRQCLRTLLLIQVYGAPVVSPSLLTNPPQKVLEIGCGSGFWSMMCHRYYKERGHTGISFTGIDIVPLAPGSTSAPADAFKADKDMDWKFVQHDLRQAPWPLPDEEFDLIMVKDACLSIPNVLYQSFMEEYIRMLKPGGYIEMWESDTTLRMLRPHVPTAAAAGSEEAEEHESVLRLGAYLMTPRTPLSPPLNTFLVEYNQWVTRALDARTLTAMPCALISPFLMQEADTMTDIRWKRLAIPLSEVRWEREGVGGIVTKDGKSYVETKGKGPPHQKVEKKALTPGQAALRRTALLTVVQQVQALEPLLREASGKSQDEFDIWLGKMTADLMSESGTSWGECLEVGAWSARKRPTP